MSLAFDLIAPFTSKDTFPYWIYYDLCWADLAKLKEDIILVAYEALRVDESNIVEHLE